jgi:hypothetical protein
MKNAIVLIVGGALLLFLSAKKVHVGNHPRDVQMFLNMMPYFAVSMVLLGIWFFITSF